MPLLFHPKQGMVLICDYHGFVVPEMVKRRRVIVISPYQQNKRGICTVVPFSTTTPDVIEPFHVHIPAVTYSWLSDTADSWVKADMLNTVSLKRLDRIRQGSNFISPSLHKDDFAAVLQSVKNYLDF